MRITGSFRRSSAGFALVALAVLLGAACSTLPGARASDTGVSRVDLGEIAFDLAGHGWQASGLEHGIGFMQTYGPRRTHGIAVWIVDVPFRERQLGRDEQAVLYFRAERELPRDPPWAGFHIATREIDGIPYPVMTFTIPSLDGGRQGEGLFLLDFPPDFTARQRFYVLMWTDVHPAGTPGDGLEILERAVRTLAIKPFEQQV